MFNITAQLARSLAVICCCLALSSCGSVNLAYSLADDLIVFRLDGYFDLNSEQKRELKSELKELQQWHRSTELPLYQKLLTGLQGDIQQPVRRERLDYYYQQLAKRRDALVEEIIPRAAKFLAGLSPEQVQNAVDELREEAEDEREERAELTDEEIYEEYWEELLDNFEDWFGSVESGQSQQLETLARRWWEEDAERRAQRQREQDEAEWLVEWQDLLLADREDQAKALEEELERGYRSWFYPNDTSEQNERHQRQKDRIVEFDLLLLAKQRKYAHDELQGYIDSIAKLSEPD